MSNLSFGPQQACAALRQAGLDLAPAQVRVEPRENRWLVSLPGDRLAWFGADAAGRARIARERRVLRLLAARCAFAAPRILFESDDFDVRAAVPGLCDPWDSTGALWRTPRWRGGSVRRSERSWSSSIRASCPTTSHGCRTGPHGRSRATKFGDACPT